MIALIAVGSALALSLLVLGVLGYELSGHVARLRRTLPQIADLTARAHRVNDNDPMAQPTRPVTGVN